MKRFIALLAAALLAACVLPFSGIAAETAVKDGEILIHDVYIEGLLAPVAGETPEHSCTLYVEENPEYVLVYQYWHDNTLGEDMFVEQVPFEADHLYSQGCMIAPNEGYALADDCVYHFNGDAALVDQVSPSYFEGCVFVQSVPMACQGSEPEPLMGDVDGSGDVNAADALLTLRYSMGLVGETALDLSVADVDGSGDVNVSDALIIMRRAMGLV